MKRKKIKEEIYKSIDLIDDKDFLLDLQDQLNKKLQNFELSRDEKNELDQLKNLHQEGKSKTFTVEEARKGAHKKKSEK